MKFHQWKRPNWFVHNQLHGDADRAAREPCNTTAYTAWQANGSNDPINGLDAYTSTPSSGVSQQGTVTNFDQATAVYDLYAQSPQAFTAAKTATTATAVINGGNGTIIVVTTITLPGYFPTAPLANPPPSTTAALTLPFAPNPPKPASPKCPKGYYVSSSSPIGFSCTPIPVASRL